MSVYRIYGLTDSQTNEVRYVGQTSRELNDRLYGYLRNVVHWVIIEKPRLDAWLQDELRNYRTPGITCLETVDSQDEANEAERRWIKHYHQHGRIFNKMPGGRPQKQRRRMTPEEMSRAINVLQGREPGRPWFLNHFSYLDVIDHVMSGNPEPPNVRVWIPGRGGYVDQPNN